MDFAFVLWLLAWDKGTAACQRRTLDPITALARKINNAYRHVKVAGRHLHLSSDKGWVGNGNKSPLILLPHVQCMIWGGNRRKSPFFPSTQSHAHLCLQFAQSCSREGKKTRFSDGNSIHAGEEAGLQGHRP